MIKLALNAPCDYLFPCVENTVDPVVLGMVLNNLKSIDALDETVN